jgi:hypothetical protein
VPASFVELAVENGFPSFYCPVSGVVLFNSEEGFDPDADHSPFLRVFIDWDESTVWLADIDALPVDARGLQERLTTIFTRTLADEEKSINDAIDECIKAMPNSAAVFELHEPGRGGGHEGSVCYAFYDFAGASSGGALEPVRLVEAK